MDRGTGEKTFFQVNFGIVIIGSEILSGKRRDAHLAHAIAALGGHGLELAWCRIVGDEPERITETLRETMAGKDAAFCFGGIGATPDDHTRRCAAAAANLACVRHPEAAALIEKRFGEAAYPKRIRMADLPQGCGLIPNPVNQIPGFSVADHHFVPGFPHMAWPMMEWVLEHRYAHFFKNEADTPVEIRLNVIDASEGHLIDIIETLVEKFPEIRFSCLPHVEGDYRETELGVRGVKEYVAPAAGWLIDELDRGGFRWEKV